MNNIVIMGKPNSGKSLLFNRLTGLRQKVANFPGVTVDIKEADYGDYRIIDFPGIYSLNALTKDEEIAVEKFYDALQDNSIRVIVCNLDATRLERSLVLGLQVQSMAKKHGRAIIFTLNMIDEVEKTHQKIEVKNLEKELGSPVFPLSAKTTQGMNHFKEKLQLVLAHPENFIPHHSTDERDDILKESKKLGKKYGANVGVLLKNQNVLDHFFLNSFWGGMTFFVIMTFLFQAIFTWASPLMDFTEELMGLLASFTTGSMDDGVFKDFVEDALFGGLGSFLVFVPQIMTLTFLIGLLEDSGYLARAVIICHRPLAFFGLSGKSFIPYLSGFACAIPAMMAARTIESPKKRFITLLTLPLMSCSARLPVYALFIVALIPNKTFFGGLIGYQGIAFFSLYFFGVAIALLVSAFLSKFVYKDLTDSPFIIELPPYRLPHLKPLILRTIESGKSFVTNAGKIIFIVTVAVWFLGYFPNHGDLSTSYLASIGKVISPIFSPLSIDWKYGVAILVSFLAREVFVGTLGTLFGIEGADENVASLATQVQASGMTLGTAISLLVFYMIALQCVATVAMLQKETGSGKKAWGIFAIYSLLAYGLALVTNFILN